MLNLIHTIFSKILFLIPASLIFISGCTVTPHVQIYILNPASVTLPPTINRVGVLNRSWFNKPDTTLFEKSGDPFFEPVSTSASELSNYCIAGLEDVLSDSPRLEYVDLGDINIDVNDNGLFLSPNEWDQIQNLCVDSLVDALVVLKFVDYYDLEGYSQDEEGEEYKYYALYTKNSWRIYDPFGQRILDNYENTDTTGMVLSTEANFLGNLFAYNPDREQEVANACYRAGRNYSNRISPQWMEVDRKYFVWPDNAATLAYQYVLENRWEEAAMLWNKMTTSSRKNAASKACYNMALASEMLDNYDMAIYWAKKSLELKPRIGTEQYIRILEQRIDNKKILDKQMAY
jgi:hypothetical protein